MLPGRTFMPEDIWRIVKRRFWLLIVPFAVVSAATAVYVKYLPDVYRSEALIAVEPPQVPSSIVRTTLVTDLDDRLPAIRNTITTRNNLERVIQDLNLYVVERRTGIMEDIVEKMRTQIVVAPIRGSAIRVGFEGGNPREVQRVAARLADMVILESTQDREALIQGTDQFLADSVERARQRLVEKETSLAQYQLAHRDELPSQMQANLQAAQNLHTQIQSLLTASDRDQERRLVLERQLVELESQPVEFTGDAGQAGTTEQQLRAARIQLTNMELTKKADHPDVQAMKRVIRDLETKLDQEALEAPLSAGGGRTVNPAEASRNLRLQDLRNQIAQIDQQAARSKEAIAQMRAAAAEYQRRAEAAPVRQTEMVELNRDYNTLNSTYVELLRKKEDSSLTATMERRQIGESFRLIETARIPARPASPNRQRMNLMGMGAGLAVGLVLVGLLEYRDSTLKTDDDLKRVLGMPVLAVVPLMQSDQERRQTLRRRVLVSGVLGSTVLGCLAILTYTFVR